VQGEDSNYYDQHDHGHKDNQDRSDHHTIPLIWPRGGASQTRAAICASLPRKCKHPNFLLRQICLNSDCVGRYTPCHAIRELSPTASRVSSVSQLPRVASSCGAGR
jgi:hypothetical protein